MPQCGASLPQMDRRAQLLMLCAICLNRPKHADKLNLTTSPRTTILAAQFLLFDNESYAFTPNKTYLHCSTVCLDSSISRSMQSIRAEHTCYSHSDSHTRQAISAVANTRNPYES